MITDTQNVRGLREWVAAVLALVVVAAAAGGVAQVAERTGLAAAAMGAEEFRSVDALGTELPLAPAQAQYVAAMLDLKRPPTHERVEVTVRGGSDSLSTDRTTLTTYLESYAGGRKLRVLGSRRVDDFRFTAESSSRDSVVLTAWSRGDSARAYHGQTAYYDRTNATRPLLARSWYHDTGRATLRAHLSAAAGQAGLDAMGDTDSLAIARALAALAKNRAGDTDFAIDTYRIEGAQPRFRLISQQGMVYEVVGGTPQIPLATGSELESLSTSPVDEPLGVGAVLGADAASVRRARVAGAYETYSAFAGVSYRAATTWELASYYEIKGSSLALRGRRSTLTLVREDARVEQEYWFGKDGKRALKLLAEYPAGPTAVDPIRLTVGIADGGDFEVVVTPGVLTAEAIEQLRRDYPYVTAIVAARAKIKSPNPLELVSVVRDAVPGYTLVDSVTGVRYVCTHPKGIQAPATCVAG